MVGWKKFLLLPLWAIVYLTFVASATSPGFSFAPAVHSSSNSPDAVAIGVDEAVSVSVIRPYFFGLITLPVYSPALGDLGGYHNFFFASFFLLALAFIVLELRARGQPAHASSGYASYASASSTSAWRTPLMAQHTIDVNRDKLLRGGAVGLVLGIVCFLLSGEGGPSIALAILVAYLEYNSPVHHY